jgi:hypothetical protein
MRADAQSRGLDDNADADPGDVRRRKANLRFLRDGIGLLTAFCTVTVLG